MVINFYLNSRYVNLYFPLGGRCVFTTITNIILRPTHSSRVQMIQISWDNAEGISEKLKLCFYRYFALLNFADYVGLLAYRKQTEKQVNFMRIAYCLNGKLLSFCTFYKSIKKVFSCRECIAHTLLLLSHWYQAEWSYTKSYKVLLCSERQGFIR